MSAHFGGQEAKGTRMSERAEYRAEAERNIDSHPLLLIEITDSRDRHYDSAIFSAEKEDDTTAWDVALDEAGYRRTSPWRERRSRVVESEDDS